MNTINLTKLKAAGFKRRYVISTEKTFDFGKLIVYVKPIGREKVAYDSMLISNGAKSISEEREKCKKAKAWIKETFGCDLQVRGCMYGVIA